MDPMIGRNGILLFFLLLTLTPAISVAQEGKPCTWDTCALRLESRAFGERLVRGVEAEEVANIGFFPPDLAPLFEERSSTAAAYYQDFRSKETSGSALLLVGLAAYVAGGIANHKGEEGLAIGLLIGGVVSQLVGGLRVRAGREDFSRAVWWYNRTLVDQ